MHRFRKGQVGIETFGVIIILSFIFLYSFIANMQRTNELNFSDKQLSALRECYRVSSLINRVRSNEEGFVEHSSFTDYEVMIYGNKRELEVLFNGDYVYCTFSTVNVTNGTSYNFKLDGEYRVVNNGINVTFQKS